MSRYFNTTGPCDRDQHFMLPPLPRLPELRRLIDERRFYVIHAARQSGKTTAVRAMAAELRSEGMVALHVSLESSRQTPGLAEAEPRWLWDIRNTASLYLPPQDCPPSTSEMTGPPGTQLSQLLQVWAARVFPLPLVIFFDEVDTLEGEALVSFLAQLRAGFDHRPRGFASSIGLVGMRDLTAQNEQGRARHSSSRDHPFNIKSHSLLLRSFSQIELAELYEQYTAESGQAFNSDALRMAYELTAGQPYLVNALGYYLTREAPVPLSREIGADDITRARERIMVARTGYLENLSDLLRERRGVRNPSPRSLESLLTESDEPLDEDSTASILVC